MWREKAASFREKYGEKALLAASFVLVIVLAYEAGSLRRELQRERPLVIHEPAVIPAVAPVRKATSSTGTEKTVSTYSVTAPASPRPSSALNSPDCRFVGSKNSNKYHVPTSSCAKQIKPENRVCFKDEADAAAHGYAPGCLTP